MRGEAGQEVGHDFGEERGHRRVVEFDLATGGLGAVV